MQDKITLTPQDILNKQFKIDMKGYSLKEVDGFLDQIIGDYEQFDAIIAQYESEKNEYLREIMNLKQELRNIKMSIDVAKGGDKEVTNLDILRRISNLEKIVYGKDKRAEEEIEENN
mgnify:CR=1 FL=1